VFVETFVIPIPEASVESLKVVGMGWCC